MVFTIDTLVANRNEITYVIGSNNLSGHIKTIISLLNLKHNNYIQLTRLYLAIKCLY